jgi:TonB family protein
MITYAIQVSVALILFYLGYAICLKQQTNFALVRSYLLFSLVASTISPLINFRAIASAFLDVTPEPAFESTWLPEVTVTAIQTTESNSAWLMLTLNIVYIAGAILSALFLIVSIVKLKQILAQAKPKQDHGGWYYRLSGMQQSFSFFHYIFLGDNPNHSEQEQRTILAHERAHAQLGHSFDVLLARMVIILVWFNPVAYWFKRKLEEVHEFQADAQTIQSETAQDYCVLLARETLESHHISVANHFNRTLTLKRIRMIQTLKVRISPARLAALMAVIVVLFSIISCEEKVLTDLKNAAKQSVLVTEYPEVVKQAVEKVKALDQHAAPRVYGLVKTSDIALFEDEAQTITYISVPGDPDFSGYVILTSKDIRMASEFLSEKRGSDEVFTIVEELPHPVNGMEEFYKMLMQNIKYPVAARNKNIEGRVFVQFMVDENGKLSDFQVVKGIGSGCDEEAMRVLSLSEPWVPGKQRGVAVKSIFNLAIIFKLREGNASTAQPD